MSDKQLTTIKKQIIPVIEDALTLKIKSQADLVTATEILSKLNKFVDKVTEEKEKVTRPLNEALKAERARWKPIENQYTEAIETVRKLMTDYQTNLVKQQKEEEMKIAARIGEGKGKLRIETAVKKLDAITKAEKEYATTEGLVQFAEQKVLKITDLSLIPRQYLIVDEKAVLEALKAGQSVPGAELDTIQVPRNYR